MAMTELPVSFEFKHEAESNSDNIDNIEMLRVPKVP
jgi:hypothetical protein